MDKYRVPSGSSNSPHSAVTSNSSCGKGVSLMGCGCLIMGLLFVVGIGSFIYFISNMMKSSDPYRDSLAAAKQHPAVIESLGEPIKPGFFLTGSFNSSSDSGSADLEYSISGPNGKAAVSVVGEKSEGVWTYKSCKVTLPDRDKPVRLKP